MILVLSACTGWFGGADTSPESTDSALDTAADPDTASEAALADDARVRALTDLPEGKYPCRAPLLARVSHITDGDTVYVKPEDGSADLKVRFIGVDTPEIAHDTPADCYGDEAMAYTSSQLLERLVWLTFDAGCTDPYGRSLAYVIRGDGETGFYNRVLVRNGWAWPLTIDPDTTYASTFEADSAAAEREGLGLWSACP